MLSSFNDFKSTALWLTNKLMFIHAVESFGICSHISTRCSYISHVSVSDSHVSDSYVSDSHVNDSHVSDSHVSDSHVS